MKYYLQTFWCQMNIADSEKINMLLAQAWITRCSDPLSADLIIINTCSVRKKWEDKVYSLMHDILKTNKKNWKKCIIWLTWCMVRKTWIKQWLYETQWKRIAARKIETLSDADWIFNSDDKIFWRTDKVDFVFRIEDLSFLTKILSLLFKKEIWNDSKYYDYLKLKQLQENPWSANIVIQTWCDNFCSYCIVPHTRWREISRWVQDILNDINDAVSKWTKEVVLIWQNVNSYWKESKARLWNLKDLKWKTEWTLTQDFKTPFRELLDKIDLIEWLDRIRFTSSNPHDMTKDILDAHFELKHTCNYLHFALQSWDNEILKKMNRRHTYEDFKAQVEYLRSKDPLFSISTDIIVWFPGETEAQFGNTIRAFEELEFDFAYIARYSPRPWTISADILKDDIWYKEKARRWHILNDLLEKNLKKRSKLMIWQIEDVLIYWITKDNKAFWRTRNYKEITFPITESFKIWDIVKIKIEKMNGWVLDWKII